MSDFDSHLPVRGTAADLTTKVSDSAGSTINPAKEDGHLATIDTSTADLDSKINTQGQKTMSASTPVVLPSDQSAIPEKLQDGSGNPITSQVSGAQRALDVGIDVAGVQIDPRQIRALTNSDVVKAQIQDNSGAAITLGQKVSASSVPVVIASDQSDVNVNQDKIAGTATSVNTGNADAGTQRVVIASNQPAIPVDIGGGVADNPQYNTASAVASNASNTQTFSPGSTFNLEGVDASASGRMKVEVQWGTTGSETSKWVAFTSTSNLVVHLVLPHPVTISSGMSVKVIRTNLDNQAQDVYSTIFGH